jgi:hypothetical protein
MDNNGQVDKGQRKGQQGQKDKKKKKKKRKPETPIYFLTNQNISGDTKFRLGICIAEIHISYLSNYPPLHLERVSAYPTQRLDQSRSVWQMADDKQQTGIEKVCQSPNPIVVLSLSKSINLSLIRIRSLSLRLTGALFVFQFCLCLSPCPLSEWSPLHLNPVTPNHLESESSTVTPSSLSRIPYPVSLKSSALRVRVRGEG